MAKTASQNLLRDLNQRIGQLENEKSLMAKYMGRLESQLAAAMSRMDRCTCSKDREMTCIVHPTDRSLRYRIAELEAANAALKEALTPSSETKRAYWGDDSTRCLPWTDIKALMALIRKRAALQEVE